MSYRVRIDSFEGPFDLLLYLVSRQKVDIGSISVTQIVDQYIAYVDRMERLDLEDVTLDALGLLAADAMARRDVFLLESEHIAAKPIPVETHVRAIHRRISVRKHMMFSELLADAPDAAVRVVSFLAVLELYKRTMVRLEQSEPFSDIAIDFIEGSGELVFDEDDEKEWS